MPDASPDPAQSRFGETAKFLPVAFVVCNIGGLYAIYMVLHCLPLLQNPETHTLGIVETAVFNSITALLVLAYVQCILVHPGTIPDKDEDPTWEYVPTDGRAAQLEGQLQETKKSGDRRHCKWCAKYKPDRCHHCRVCRMCILKMDHHCPWIYNCVGFRNHKYFFLLLLYASIDCNFIAITMLPSVKNSVDTATPFATMFLLLFGETLAAFIGILVTAFFGFHIYLMLKAMTTIEYCEKFSKKGAKGSAYDRGIAGNIRAVLGDNPLLWLLPCSPPSGRGLYFTNEETMLTRDLEGNRGVPRRGHRRSSHRSSERHHGERREHHRSSRRTSSATGAGTGSAPASNASEYAESGPSYGGYGGYGGPVGYGGAAEGEVLVKPWRSREAKHSCP